MYKDVKAYAYCESTTKRGVSDNMKSIPIESPRKRRTKRIRLSDLTFGACLRFRAAGLEPKVKLVDVLAPWSKMNLVHFNGKRKQFLVEELYSLIYHQLLVLINLHLSMNALKF